MRLAIVGADERLANPGHLRLRPPGPVVFGDEIAERPAAVHRAAAPVPRVRDRSRIVAAQRVVRRIGEAFDVGIECAAKTAATDLVKLAVPAAYRQTDVEVNRRPYETKNTAIRRQIARGRHFDRRKKVDAVEFRAG